MQQNKLQLILLSLLLGCSGLFAAADATQVMPAKQRTKIVSTAKALFEPQVKNSLKIGRVSSPFSVAPSAP